MAQSDKKNTGKKKPAQNDDQTSEREPSESIIKSFEAFHVLLVFAAVSILLALVQYTPISPSIESQWGNHTGILGKTGGMIAEVVIRSSFGRFGSFALPCLMFLFLIGLWTHNLKSVIKPAIGIVTAGFFTALGISYFRNFKHLPLNDDLAGTFINKLNDYSFQHIGATGTALISLTIILIVLIFLVNLRLSKIFPTLFITFPSWLGLTIFNFAKAITKAIIPFFALMGSLAKKNDTNTETDSEEPQEITETPPFQISDPETEQDAEPPAEKIIHKEPRQTRPTPRPVVHSGPVQESTGKRSLPPIDLLDPLPLDRPMVNHDELEDNSRRLEDKLLSLKIEAKVIRTVPGPIITRYDLKPAPTVKIARIASSADDIAMALRARGVRILAPIPGEAAVGVEIPNRNPETVYIKEIIGSDEFRNGKSPLTIGLGKDSSGEIYCIDLTKTPHLLIAGATGSGKSVCINSIIASILFRADPDKVRLVLIDPKKLELSLYARLVDQHLVAPPGLGETVITTPENAVKTLQSVHMEMERRYDILTDAGVRGLDEYHRWLTRTAPSEPDEEDIREHLPYLVVIIDELADLMMVVRREFEELVARLAQMARAVGIHLVVATQRPSVDVVTGLIKANFPSRIAFHVASKFDSRTIIDIMGAESLLGKGDMLFQGPGTSHLKRLHAALVTTEEVERVIEFVRAQPPRTTSFKLPNPEIEKITIYSDGDESSVNSSDNDKLFEEAAKIVVRTEQGSISVLQRRLRVGYARAARIIDELERAGIVGEFDGSKAREVLVSVEELRERHGIE